MIRKLLMLVLVVLLVFAIMPPGVLATDDDFEIAYTVSPNPVGYMGGDIRLLLTVTNTGPTNITWVDVNINTNTPYYQHWTGTITPGAHRTISFMVPFTPSDLDEEKVLLVSMNNNSTANPDGINISKFEIESTSEIFDVACSISPEQDTYAAGDTVTITHRFTNIMELDAATNMQSEMLFSIGLDIFSEDETSHGNVFPGSTVSHSYTYTFDDEGTVDVGYRANFDMMGETYNISEWWTTLTVEPVPTEAPVPDIDFNVHLSADPTVIDEGDTVDFYVSIENTGDDAIGTFEIRNAEGGVEAETEALDAGDSGTVTLCESIYESTDVNYVVIGCTGGESESRETNIVHITVRDPAPESSDSPSASIPSDSSPTVPSDSPSATVSLEDSMADVSPIAVDAAATDTGLLDAAATDPVEKTMEVQSTSNMFLYIIIGVLVILIVSGMIVAIVLYNKSKKK